MTRMPGQRIPTIDPFAPHLSPTLARGIKELLVGPRVQEINFDFGSVLGTMSRSRTVSPIGSVSWNSAWRTVSPSRQTAPPPETSASLNSRPLPTDQSRAER